MTTAVSFCRHLVRRSLIGYHRSRAGLTFKTHSCRALTTGILTSNIQQHRNVSTGSVLRCGPEISDNSFAQRLAKNNITVPVFMKAEEFKSRTAIITHKGRYSYDDLLHYSAALAKEFKMTVYGNFVARENDLDLFPLDGQRIAFLCENDMSYVVAQWATWLCGAVAVPLSKSHPASDLQYFIKDSGASMVVCTEKFKDKIEPVAKKLRLPLKVMTADHYIGDPDHMASAWSGSIKQDLYKALSENAYRDRRAMIIYTSGTTDRPKGVVHTFGNLDAMIQGMISAWHWSADDVILHVLPLNHVHGVVNVLMTPLYVGAKCVILPNFDPKQTWKSLLSPDLNINLMMAVPTVYAKLIDEYDKQAKSSDPYLPNDLHRLLQQKIRLMVSGSAALPTPVMQRWEQISGHRLLERYGMTETGMVLTNPLYHDRLPGAVGLPFPGVTVRLVEQPENMSTQTAGYKTLVSSSDKKATIEPGCEGEHGEIHVKGDNVFSEYWNKPQATKETFTADGWFKTGDTGTFEDGVFRIIGRTSVDVIKSGGYKISALEVERCLLSHPDIRDVAVIGLPNETWGELVTAVVVTYSGEPLHMDDLQHWAKETMIPYLTPRVIKCLPEMPRNSMGKVNKKALARDLFPEYFKD